MYKQLFSLFKFYHVIIAYFRFQIMEQVLLKNPFVAFLKLIRVQNLLIVAITMFCIKYFVFAPINEYSKLTPFLFWILVVSTLFITAAGYIINDYFDVKTDKINRQTAVVLDITIKRRWAMILHLVFNGIGLLLGLFLALKSHHLSLLLIQLLSVVLLWFYSTHFKRQLLIGNLVIAFLTAVVPLLPMVYEYYLTEKCDLLMAQMVLGDYFDLFPKVVIVYAIFAFLTSLTREIIKDLEDFKGDIQTGCKTMPIVWGIITSKVFVFFTTIIIIGLLLLTTLKFYNDEKIVYVSYILTLLVAPLLILLFLLTRATTKEQFNRVSLLLKFVMLFGIAFTFILKL